MLMRRLLNWMKAVVVDGLSGKAQVDLLNLPKKIVIQLKLPSILASSWKLYVL